MLAFKITRYQRQPTNHLGLRGPLGKGTTSRLRIERWKLRLFIAIILTPHQGPPLHRHCSGRIRDESGVGPVLTYLTAEAFSLRFYWQRIFGL